MNINRFAATALFLGLLLTPLMAGAVTSSGDGGIIPNCDPSLLPNSTSTGVNGAPPCELNAFATLLANIISYMAIIVVPIAACMIGYAGFIILTSGGNAERVTKGYGMIKIAMTGLLLLLGSYLVIKGIFIAFDITETIGTKKLPSPI